MSDDYDGIENDGTITALIETQTRMINNSVNAAWKAGKANGLTQCIDVVCAAIQNMESFLNETNKDNFSTALKCIVTIKKQINGLADNSNDQSFGLICQKLNFSQYGLSSKKEFDAAIKHTATLAAHHELEEAKDLIENAQPIEAQKTMSKAADIYEIASIEPHDDEFYLSASNGDELMAELFKTTVVKGEERSITDIMYNIQVNAAKAELRVERQNFVDDVADNYGLTM